MIKDVKKKIIIIIIIVLLLASIGISIYYLTKSSPPPTPPQISNVEKMFNNINNKQPNTGGILIHMLQTSDLNKIIKNNSIELSGMADCAAQYRHTCSAWTLLRKDLPPMPFIFPGMNTTVGIMVNPNKIWDSITTMAVIDSDTNNRSCCTNESGLNIITKWPSSYQSDTCFNSLLDRRYSDGRYDEYVAYISSSDHGGTCPLICKTDDLYCQYNNTGAGINTWIMNEQAACYDQKYDQCYKFTEIDESKVPLAVRNDPGIQQGNKPKGYLVQSTGGDCPLCEKPYLCVTEKSPDNKHEMMINEPKKITTYVGKNGEDWTKTFMVDNAFGSGFDTGTIAGLQCKYEKKDWGQWIKSMRLYYTEILTILYANNSLNTEYNYLLANGNQASYLENEVNIYVNPDNTTTMYKQQQQEFIDSIIGFFYIPTDCETQMKVLEGIPSTVDGTTTLTGSVDRCDNFFAGMSLSGQKRRDYEEKSIKEGKNAVINITKWYNKKYNKNINGFALNANTNSFPNYDVYNLALQNKIDYKKLFKIIV